MTVISKTFPRLQRLCWPAVLLAWLQLLPIGSAQDGPQLPQQAEQPVQAEQARQAGQAEKAGPGEPRDGGAVDGADGGADGDADVIVAVGQAEARAAEGGAEGGVVVVDAMLADAQNPLARLLGAYARVNCALARRASDLSAAEEQKLQQLNDAWIAKQLSESVESPLKNVAAGIARFLGGRAVEVQIRGNDGDAQQSAIHRIKKKIDAAIDEALDSDHRAAFQREREARDQFRRQAMAGVLAAALDNRVFLAPQEREALEREVAQWLTTELSWQFYFQNTNYIPDIPKRVLSKALSAEQLEALEGVQAWNYELSQLELQMMVEMPIVIER